MTKTAVSVIKDFLRADPNPPDPRELMDMLKTVSRADRIDMAKSIDPSWKIPAEKPE